MAATVPPARLSGCYVVVVSFSARVSELLREWGDGRPPKVDVMLLDATTVPRTPWLDDDCERPMAVILASALHARRGDLTAARRGLRTVMTLQPVVQSDASPRAGIFVEG